MDATVTDNVARSYVNLTARSRGAAAIKAEKRKYENDKRLAEPCIFIPIAIEPFESIGPLGAELLHNIGRKLTGHTGEPRSHLFDSDLF